VAFDTLKPQLMGEYAMDLGVSSNFCLAALILDVEVDSDGWEEEMSVRDVARSSRRS